ncbi:molybdopterin synthase sulfur carrier subunit [Bremerella cremea]|uniref:Molybdopterin synthase sulfur carrier subunit n=1 Tax=Blastopirellula marina TaxID=124 RepID=A0A2S8FB26_9BACT|nr:MULTISPECIES: MoaD/ThiS family protein [Pirellulaceae]PQO29339.1 molybdopterin synthase sulfur carrier subunit [Blastopirellula marina]RCS42643.1 molybdopterin synthase sulfur carrier subunit [Bremerella cremea]
MAIVFIPAPWRDLTNQQPQVEVDATTLRELIDELDRRFPGIHTRLCENDTVRPSIQISLDGTLISRNLRTSLDPQTEVHFLPALGGG